jgi:hypothetical protein
MNERATQFTVDATVHRLHPDGTSDREVLAHGFLIGPLTVLLPDAPKQVGDPWQRYSVRITRDPDPGDGPEMVRVAGIRLAAIVSDGISTAAASVALVTASRHAAVAPLISRDALIKSFQEHKGDLWAVYAALGYPIRPPERVAPAERWWRVDDAVHEPAEFLDHPCCVSGKCKPCPSLQAPI